MFPEKRYSGLTDSLQKIFNCFLETNDNISKAMHHQLEESCIETIHELIEETTGQNHVLILSADLKQIFNRSREDAFFMLEEDPAAESLDEVMCCYPGFKALFFYRLAHYLLNKGIRMLPRMIGEQVHAQTGIDIHPGALIDSPVMIDHGTGVVIGATASIGHHVKIFQGVTLGAISVQKHPNHSKRHPTVEDYVTLYAYSCILGGGTVIGHHSIIGGNTQVTSSVKPYSVVYHQQHNQIVNRINRQETERKEPVGEMNAPINFVI